MHHLNYGTDTEVIEARIESARTEGESRNSSGLSFISINIQEIISRAKRFRWRAKKESHLPALSRLNYRSGASQRDASKRPMRVLPRLTISSPVRDEREKRPGVGGREWGGGVGGRNDVLAASEGKVTQEREMETEIVRKRESESGGG